MCGMVVFNPLLMSKNVPSRLRVGLAALLTAIIAPGLQGTAPTNLTDFGLVLAIGKEMLAGLACGFIFQIFYYLLMFAGDVMDLTFGLSMAKVFDPGTNIQMSLSGKLLDILFFLYFFATDSHLVLIRIFTSSFSIIPIGQLAHLTRMSSFVMQLFVNTFSLVMRLTMPFIAADMVLEVAMGILMKLIPQINVFVVSMQLKILLGITLMFLFAAPISNFITNYTDGMLKAMEQVLYSLKASAG
jgi:flagellar biosynthetic protein FliR